MRLLVVLFLVFIFSDHHAFTQCKADSVITYRIVGGMNQIATVEYFLFDSQDSLVKHSLIDYMNEKPLPIQQTEISYYKSGSNFIRETKLYLWQPSHAEFQLSEIYQVSRNKKNQIISESYFVPDEKTNVSPSILTSQFLYSYSKSGELISKTFSEVSDLSGKNLQAESKILYTYTNSEQTQATTLECDSLKGVWTEKWRNDFTYDSLHVLQQMVSYEFRNEAWIPITRTVYGSDSIKQIKWNIVQNWDWAKEAWTNKFYYIFQLNKLGQTITEVHLDWVRKEWMINLTVHYVYDQNGFLMQILNGEKQVIVNRFCRNSPQ